ncbi:MAG: hypothetical protein ABIW79_03300 [Gemmatimonas sp.]
MLPALETAMNPWDEKFSVPEYRYGTSLNEFLVSHVGELPTGRILCLAEGEGRNAVFLAKLGFAVHATDLSDLELLGFHAVPFVVRVSHVR